MSAITNAENFFNAARCFFSAEMFRRISLHFKLAIRDFRMSAITNAENFF